MANSLWDGITLVLSNHYIVNDNKLMPWEKNYNFEPLNYTVKIKCNTSDITNIFLRVKYEFDEVIPLH